MARNPPRVCVVGSTNADLTFRAPRLPRVGETLAGTGFDIGFGGKGANQAVMAARLGARVTMVSRVGRDVFGELLLANFREQGVDASFVAQDDRRPSGVAAITVDEQARNCIIVVAGANAALGVDDVRRARAAVEQADVVLCQLETPTDATREAFRLARAAGARTVLNPAPAADLPADLLALADLCVPNEIEAEHLTGRAVAEIDQAAEAGRHILRAGAQSAIITLGDRGAVVIGREGVYPIAPVSVRAVDPTGAGDAFIGSLAVYLAEGLSLADAAARANRVAALSVTRPGAQASFPSRADVEAWRGD